MHEFHEQIRRTRMTKMDINYCDQNVKKRLHLHRQKAYDLDSGKIGVKSEGLLPMVGEKSKK